MTQAYTPGLKVAARMVHRARRTLPIPGDVLVEVGQHVDARQVVAQTLMPGDVTPVNVAHLLAVSPEEVPATMLKREGEPVGTGELLAKTQGMFGLFQSQAASPMTGLLETVSKVTGQVMLRGKPLAVSVEAFLTGTVVELLPHSGVVIEAEVTFLQGIFGIGGEAYGPIRCVCATPSEALTDAQFNESHRGAVIVCGARVTAGGIAKAVKLGVAAIVTGGIDDQDLRDFLGNDLGVAVTGHERVGLTLIVTEGFGDIAMADRSFQLLRSREGSLAAVNGATQIRAGVLRPEVVIPWENAAQVPLPPTASSGGGLELGVLVRLIRDPYFGKIGTVSALPHEPRLLASESKARVLEVQMAKGEKVIVPRANVERIEVEADA